MDYPEQSARNAGLGVEIVLVGRRESSTLSVLAEALQRDGWPCVHVDNPGEAADRVGFRRKAVVVVRTDDQETALRLLEQLDVKRHSAMVIVIVDRADPGDYYCLMRAGAIEYFEVREDPVRILQGVEWAARVLAP